MFPMDTDFMAMARNSGSSKSDRVRPLESPKPAAKDFRFHWRPCLRDVFPAWSPKDGSCVAGGEESFNHLIL